MIRFLLSTVINAVGLWVVANVVPGIHLHPYGGTDVWPTIGSFLLIGAIFGIINATIAPVIKILAFPLYILTFGLISLVINGAVLLFVAWLSNLIHDGNGISIDGFTPQGLTIASMGTAILGALLLSVFSFIGRWLMKVTRVLS